MIIKRERSGRGNIEKDRGDGEKDWEEEIPLNLNRLNNNFDI